MNRSETITKLAMSLVKFNGEVTKIAKDKSNPFFKSRYVTLDTLIEETRDILQSNGLIIMQSPLSKEDGSIGIQTLLLHESGEFIESEPIYMKPAKANDPQQAGSIISYMRRYSYQAILNLNTGEDDDANKSSNKYHSKEKEVAKDNKNTENDNASNVISKAQLDRLYMKARGIDTSKVTSILSKYNFSSSKEITKDKYNAICDEIEELGAKA